MKYLEIWNYAHHAKKMAHDDCPELFVLNGNPIDMNISWF